MVEGVEFRGGENGCVCGAAVVATGGSADDAFGDADVAIKITTTSSSSVYVIQKFTE